MPGLPRDTSKADVEASDIATASTAQQQSISPPEQNTVDSNIMDTNGYHKLAHLMTLAPEAALFRRFGFLNTMNLLRLQAELHDMEEKLVDVWKEDYDSGDPIRMAYAGDFRIMRDYVEDGDTTQYDLLNDIGAKLKEYSKLDRTGAKPNMLFMLTTNQTKLSEGPFPLRKLHDHPSMTLTS